jgi:repressor LexA
MMTSSEFRQIREQLGLTQEQLAAALRTTRVSVARYESGMRRISGAVQVAITQLANRTQMLSHGRESIAAQEQFAPIEPA